MLKIIGLPVFLTYACKGILLRSAEAILYKGTPNFSRKSTLSKSNGVAKNPIFCN